MIVVEIQDPEDGRLSFEVGAFASSGAAEGWKAWFLSKVDYDADFVEVRDVDRRLFDPGKPADMVELLEFHEGWS